jgi:MoaA/NifB/PqqE/SkfB family radical SAM enzyme
MQSKVVENQQLAKREFYERKIRLKCLPQMIAIYTTDACNLRCIACHFGQRTASEISISERGYQRVFDVFPLLEVVGIAGAEMFYAAGNPKGYMQKVFDEAAKHHQIRFVGFTNGTLLTPGYVRLIVEKFKWIGISIDSPNSEDYKAIRVGSNLSHVIRNIKKISDLKTHKELGRSDHPEIIVSTVITERTFKRIVEMVDLAHKVGAASIHYQDPWEGTYVNENIFKDRLKILEYLSLRREADSKARNWGIRILDRTRNTIINNMPDVKKHLEIPKESVRGEWPHCCDAPWNELYVCHNGDVKICCTSETSIGNINENGIFDLWNSPEAMGLRRRILKGNYAKDCCARCYRGYLLPLYGKKRLSQLHKAVSVGRKGMRFIRELTR